MQKVLWELRPRDAKWQWFHHTACQWPNPAKNTCALLLSQMKCPACRHPACLPEAGSPLAQNLSSSPPFLHLSNKAAFSGRVSYWLTAAETRMEVGWKTARKWVLDEKGDGQMTVSSHSAPSWLGRSVVSVCIAAEWSTESASGISWPGTPWGLAWGSE